MYPHDCKLCVFLGTFRAHDLYYCPGNGYSTISGPTVLARYGPNGRDYVSGIALARVDPIVAKALELARAAGQLA